MNFPDAYIKSVKENAPLNTPLIDINATILSGAATSNSVVYSLLEDPSGRFNIDSSSGVVTLAKALDREAEGAVYNENGDSVFRFKVLASASKDLSKSDVVQVRFWWILLFYIKP